MGVADVGHQPVNGQYLDLEHGAGAFRMGVDCRYAEQGAHLRTAHPKVRTQKKCLTLETYRASAPRIQVRPGWNQGRGSEGQRDMGLGKRSICRPCVPPAYRFYASEPEEMSRLKFSVFCGLSCVLTTLSRGIARGSSGTLSLRFVFV